jgi:hypothetical protein
MSLPRQVDEWTMYGAADQTVSSCHGCPAFTKGGSPACAWTGNHALRVWKEERLEDEDGAVYHYGHYDDLAPGKPCPKRGTRPRR